MNGAKWLRVEVMEPVSNICNSIATDFGMALTTLTSLRGGVRSLNLSGKIRGEGAWKVCPTHRKNGFSPSLFLVVLLVSAKSTN